MRRVFLAAIAVFCAVMTAAGENSGGGVSLVQKEKGGIARLLIENRFYRILILPTIGGRIVSWRDRVKDTEMIFGIVPESRDDPQGKFNGMLDDRLRLTESEYAHSVERPDAETVVVRLRGHDDEVGLGVTKTLTFRAESPVVGVVYAYSNDSQTLITGYDHGVRNFVIPGGAPRVTGRHVYCIPSTHAVRKIKADTRIQSLPEFSKVQLKTQLSAPWIAMLDASVRQGLAVSFEDNHLLGWYAWGNHDGVARPTFEWFFRDLPAGHHHETRFNLIQVDDLPGLVYASPTLLADSSHTFENDTASFRTLLRPLADLGSVVLATSLRQVGGDWSRIIPKRSFESPPAGSNTVFDFDVEFPGKGLYELRQTLSSAGREIAGWRDVISVGGVATEPLLEMSYRGDTSIKPIPGWRADDPRDAVRWDDVSRERGFMLSGPAVDGVYTELSELSLAAGRDEYESVELRIWPLANAGVLALSLEGGASLAARLRVERREEWRREGAVNIVENRLLYDQQTLVADRPMSIWITIGSGDMPVGEHRLTLALAGADGSSKKLPISARIYDVPLPRRTLVCLSGEGYPHSFPGVGFRLKDDRDGELMNDWFFNMRSHGIDFLQKLVSLPSKSRLPASTLLYYIGAVGTGRTLGADFKARPEFYEIGENLPELDFTAFDFYTDRALGHGLVRYSTGVIELGEPTPLVRHIYSQFTRYLRSKGYQDRDMFVKILDEQPADQFPAMAATARWLKEDCGLRPFGTFHQLFSHPEQLAILSPYFDMYQWGFTTRADYRKRLAEGLLESSDIIMRYTGSGVMRMPYETMAAYGWEAARLGLNGFHNHCYMRGSNPLRNGNIVLIGEDNRPVDSPAFEGLRDGMECANYVALYNEWRGLLERDRKNTALIADLDRRLELVMERFEITVETRLGIDVEHVLPVKRAVYDEAHRGLLEIMERLGETARMAGGRFAAASWNDFDFYRDGRGFAVRTASEDADEKRAASSAYGIVADITGIERNLLESDDSPCTLVFAVDRDPGRIGYSYLIQYDREPRRVTISAAGEASLMMGLTNLANAATVSGVWR